VKYFGAFVRLSHQDKRLVLGAVITLAVCQVRLLVQNTDKLYAWATQPGNGTATVERLARAVEIASRRTPGTTCLSSALVLQRLLAKNGHGSELRIGVAKDDGRFSAHAWLIHDSQILIGASHVEKYQSLAVWKTKRLS
jgi:Transglutaminase-like superfamily